MTKKDYIATAEAFRLVAPYATGRTLTTQEVWTRLVQNMVNVFAKENPRFDRERFLKAAGVR